MIGKDKQRCVAFVPCRKGSQRVKDKNTKKFANIDKGLISIKLNQLQDIDEIDEIFLTTNDEKILEYASSLNDSRIVLDKRNENLCESSTSTDQLIEYASNVLSNCIVLWTHVTSPFLSSKIYKEAIDLYSKNVLDGNHDSLMTVNNVQKFLWNINGPINYDRKKEKWPRTQTLQKIYEVNSGIFMSDATIFKKYNDRIGKKPYLMPLKDLIAFDIDWEEDWILAEQIYLNNIAKI